MPYMCLFIVCEHWSDTPE